MHQIGAGWQACPRRRMADARGEPRSAPQARAGAAIFTGRKLLYCGSVNGRGIRGGGGMAGSTVARVDGLPAPVRAVRADFLAAAREACGADLVTVALFGSAADGRLAPTSDVNLLLVLGAFGPGPAAALRPAYAAAKAAIDLRAMFPLESELAAATELFAQKFADIRRWHRVLYGADLLG